MTSILAIDTSTEACSVALWRNGELHEDFRHLPREHTRYLLPMIDQMLTSHAISLTALQAIGFGCGPGSFTGLRVCASVAQGLAFGAGLAIIPVSSLQALAQGAVEAHRLASGTGVLASLDARMGELYWAAFVVDDAGLVQPLGNEQLTKPEALSAYRSDESVPWVGVGSGWGCIGLPEHVELVDSELAPRASAVARLASQRWLRGESLPAEQAVPSYLRDQVMGS